MNNDFSLSPALSNILEMAEQQQAILDSMNGTLVNQQRIVDTVYNIANSPAAGAVHNYQSIIDGVTSNIPDLNDSTVYLVSEISNNIDNAFNSKMFPITSPDISPKQDFSDYIDKKIQESIGSEAISTMHRAYQDAPDDISNENQPSSKINNSVEHNDLRSDLISKEWHQRQWVEGIYNMIINLLFTYSIGAIPQDVLNIALTNLLVFLRSIMNN